jgi:hypothetical protein
MTKKIQRRSILKNASKFSKTETEVTNPRQIAKFFRKLVAENRSARDQSDSENSSAVGIKKWESYPNFQSKIPLSDDGSRSIAISNKMELGSCKSDIIIEEKHKLELSEELRLGELRPQTPCLGNIESLQAPPQPLQPLRVLDESPKSGQPPRELSQSDPSLSEQIPVQLDIENMYRDKIMRELRNPTPPIGPFETIRPIQH